MSCPLRLALDPAVFASAQILRAYNRATPPPLPAFVEVVTISSLTGDGELVGWSEYGHAGFDPAAPIKYRSRTLSGSLSLTSYTGTNGTGAVIYYSPASYPFPATGSDSHRWSGTATRDETGPVAMASRFDTWGEYGGFAAETGPFATASIEEGSIEPMAYAVAVTPTQRTHTGLGAVNDTRVYAPRGSYVSTGIATETLSDPDTVYAALARGTSIAGTLATTEAGTAADTSPQTYSPQAVYGATAVRVTGRITNARPGTTYGVRVGLQRYQIMPPATLWGEADFVGVLATGEETVFTYDVPVTRNFLTRFTGFYL
jgi:hypothetical protein